MYYKASLTGQEAMETVGKLLACRVKAKQTTSKQGTI